MAQDTEQIFCFVSSQSYERIQTADRGVVVTFYLESACRYSTVYRGLCQAVQEDAGVIHFPISMPNYFKKINK
jgi:hypothetical protein